MIWIRLQNQEEISALVAEALWWADPPANESYYLS
jgi:hypothetical protein